MTALLLAEIRMSARHISKIQIHRNASWAELTSTSGNARDILCELWLLQSQ
jgi:hypothetical protein